MTGSVPKPSHRILLIALGMSVMGHGQQLPLAMTLACLALVGWRYFSIRQGWAPPGRGLVGIMAILGLGAIIMYFGTIAGPEAGTALLTLMLVLKTLEIRQARDLKVLALIGMFLGTLPILFQNGPLTLAFIVFNLWLYLVSVLVLNAGENDDALLPHLIGTGRATGAIMLQALPVMLILFYLFPRLPAPVWSISRQGQASGASGLDDRMSPGKISHLSQSDALAFRVYFDGKIPDNRELYWRGPVLWRTDGQVWDSGRSADNGAASVRPTFAGPAIDYEIALEPHNRRWLYTLDLPGEDPVGGRRTQDLVAVSDLPLSEKVRYRMTSFPEARITALSDADRRRGLELPETGSDNARRLGEQWRRSLGEDRAIVARSLRYFHDEPFHYTLDPPRLGTDPVDEFLFETRRGFCEHYASAFVTLMRAAGIPSRVVTGYQGGEINPVGHYLNVRQRDAHAWAEVWLPPAGWVRVDPTAAVAPSRIENGIDSALEDEQKGGVFAAAGGLRRLLRQARLTWDAAGNTWDRLVTNYNSSSQIHLFDKLGIDSPGRLALYMAGGIIATLSLLVLLLRHREHGRLDPVQRAYGRFCSKLAHRGIMREDSEGPRAFASRIGALRPDLRTSVEAICADYILLRYGQTPAPSDLRRLQQHIRAFRP
ncbi:MAG: DUF3488 domain-containing protein [Gammaproteobacteria bacterium]|nr:DUF3488 domain-containing protein [Gammaproteobacteria bacterium]